MKNRSINGFPLTEALSAALPDSEKTLLLKACLFSGEAGRFAWQAWPGRKNRLAGETGGVQNLRGLLLSAVQRNDIVLDSESLTYLRTAYVKEELRLQIYNGVLRQVLSKISDAGIQVVVLKGAALAETVYDKPALRHCHDIDLLVRDRDMQQATALLREVGFKAANSPDSGIHHRRFEHESRLPLEMHSRLFQSSYYDPFLDEIWGRIQRRVIAAVSTYTLAPEHNLFHVCGHASYSRRAQSLRWVSDAWFLIDRHPNLDWDRLLHCARQSRMALSLYVTLRYLAENLQAPIPAAFLGRLSDAARRADALDREVAVRGALAAAPGGVLGFLHGVTSWCERLVLVRWLLFPSPAYLYRVERVDRSWLLPFYYVYRPMRSIVRSLWFLSKRLARRLRENLAPIRIAF